MTDTASAAPSDAEIDAQWRESVEKHETTAAFVRDFARTVLAKWGTLRAEKIVIPTDTMEQEFQKHYRRGYEAGKKTAPQPAQAADSVLEDAERLKEAAGLLEELAEHGSYSIEYDGQMIPICPECGEQEGDHRPDCAFARAKAFLAARKRGENHD